MANELQLIQSMTNANNAWSAEQAKKQMDFQKEMSNTAHQREVKDLQKAGLNPVLSALNGNGASTPSGAMADTDTSGATAMATILGKMLDIQSTNSAAGLLKAASGYGGTYSSGTGSAKGKENWTSSDWLSYNLLIMMGKSEKQAEAMVNAAEGLGGNIFGTGDSNSTSTNTEGYSGKGLIIDALNRGQDLVEKIFGVEIPDFGSAEAKANRQKNITKAKTALKNTGKTFVSGLKQIMSGYH